MKIEQTAQLRRHRRARGRHVDEAADYARQLAREQGLVFVHPYDDPRDHRGPGHDRPRDAGGRARPRRAGGADRRRRPDRRHRDRGQGAQARHRDHRRRAARCIPSMYRMRGEDCRGAAAARPSPRASRSSSPAASRCRSSSALVDESCWSRRPRSRPRSSASWRSRSSSSKAPAPPGSPRSCARRERFAGRRVGLILCGGNIDLRLLSVVILRGLVHSRPPDRIRSRCRTRPASLPRSRP